MGFHGLLHLGELSWPDWKNLQDFRKVIMCSSVHFHSNAYDFYLPGHKGDQFFEGNQVIIQGTSTLDDPLQPFCAYLASCDHLHRFCPELWLCANGQIPTCSWFMRRLQKHFPSDVGGHLMHAGGVTALAEAGLPPHIIQAIGCWSSEAFTIYIRQHPVLLTALLLSHRVSTAS
jgi:hypothetical protein